MQILQRGFLPPLAMEMAMEKEDLFSKGRAVGNWREYRNGTLGGLGIKEQVAENDRQ